MYEGKLTILIVDDEKELVNLYVEGIKDLSFNILTANDGVEALNVLANSEVHLVLLDLNMPKKNGFEVLEEINKNYPDVLTVISTATSLSEEEFISLIKNKVCSFLIKPTSFKELHSCVSVLEDHYRRNKYDKLEKQKVY